MERLNIFTRDTISFLSLDSNIFLEYKVYCHVMMKYFLTIIIIQDVLCAIMTVSLKDWCFG